MKRHGKHFRLALAFGLSAVFQAAGQEPAITAIDYPGSTGTQAWGINPSGSIVGLYTLADRSTRGFLLRDGKYSPIDFPEAAVTLANAINPQGDVVGEFGLTLSSAHHGFLLSGGRYTTLDYPGATSTTPTGINARGEIVGVYTTTGNIAHAFVFSGDRYTTIDYPGAANSLALGINTAGDVVGSYSSAGVSHAFLWSSGRFTSFDHPAAAGFTNATAINPRGDIVGRYRGADNLSHGYLWSGGKFTTIDIPDATFTGMTGITPGGEMVGRQTTAGINHGFLLSRRTGRYVITDLGPMGPSGQPFFISDSGVVSGTASVTDGAGHGFLWRKGVRTDLGTLGIGVANSGAYVVNERGQVVGQSETWSKDPYSEDFCGFKALGLPYWGSRCLPFLWQNGAMTRLPLLADNNGVASWINARGEIAGASENATVDPSCPAPQRFQFKPVTWQSGKIQELPTVAGDPNGVAVSINDSGLVAGATGNCSTFSPQLLMKLQPLHAVVWQNGKATDLGNLGGAGRGFGNIALAVNQLGHVTGNSDLPGDKANHAFLWTKEKGMQDLGTLPGDVNSAGIGINDRDEVVGVSLDAAFNLRAYRWQNGKMEDLNALVTGDSSLHMVLAVAINAAGEITGLAFDTRSNELHGFLAVPVGTADAGENTPPARIRAKALTDDHRRAIQQRLGAWRSGAWLAPPR
jgi:probable HAF family extracellular repeat protein